MLNVHALLPVLFAYGDGSTYAHGTRTREGEGRVENSGEERNKVGAAGVSL